jgi:HD-GYP domain-containing protein (c-di-GMP phosphodiesterase class II)
MPERLRLADLLGSLSLFADFGFGLPPQAAVRSCVVATTLARRMDVPEAGVRDAFYAALLMHFGCVSQSHETSVAFGDELALTRAIAMTNIGDPDDWAKTMVPEFTRGMPAAARRRVTDAVFRDGPEFGRRYDTGVSEVARETARRIGLPESTQQTLYELTEAWSGGWAPKGIGGDAIALPARIARAAADAAFFAGIGDADDARRALRARAGGILDPEVVEVFVGDTEGILAELDLCDPLERILELEPEPVEERDAGQLPDVAAAVGDLADLKSPWFQGHARDVARLAVATATRAGLDVETTARVQVAALLHDVGRVGTSNLVWEKPGPLTRAEWEQVRLHAYHSERIVASSPSLAAVAPLAGMHHERLDGSGYHRCAKAGELSTAARILAAADAYQAMTESRPHRDALTPSAAADQLRGEARAGRLDADVVALLLEAAGHQASRRGADLRPGGLSDREVEVLALLAAGCSNPEIAKRLFISRRTAEHHVQHIYVKIGVSTRAGAALFAVEHDLVARPDSRRFENG